MRKSRVVGMCKGRLKYKKIGVPIIQAVSEVQGRI